MKKYYTRACNFFFGKTSHLLVKKKKTLALCGNNNVSFNQIEIISRTKKKKISINQINKLPNYIREKVIFDLKK